MAGKKPPHFFAKFFFFLENAPAARAAASTHRPLTRVSKLVGAFREAVVAGGRRASPSRAKPEVSAFGADLLHAPPRSRAVARHATPRQAAGWTVRRAARYNALAEKAWRGGTGACNVESECVSWCHSPGPVCRGDTPNCAVRPRRPVNWRARDCASAAGGAGSRATAGKIAGARPGEMNGQPRRKKKEPGRSRAAAHKRRHFFSRATKSCARPRRVWEALLRAPKTVEQRSLSRVQRVTGGLIGFWLTQRFFPFYTTHSPSSPR